MKSIQSCLVVALIIVAALPIASAHSVTMNFRFHIQDMNDTIHSGSSYVSAERSGIVAALVSYGKMLKHAFDARSDPYLFRMVQDENRNRFVIALTNGSWENIEAESKKMPSATFGNLSAAGIRGLALQLQLDSAVISGAISPGQVLVKSLGLLRLPLVKLEILS